MGDHIQINVESLECVSDGFHTMEELYDHRILLWINLANINWSCAYLLKEHFEGWFLLGMNTKHGQVSYHCPNKYLDLVNTEIVELTDDSEYDGHTPSDVIDRLKKIAKKP